MNTYTSRRILMTLVYPMIAGVLTLCYSLGTRAMPVEFDAELLAIQQAWAHANYEVPAGDARAESFEKLTGRCATFTKQYPARAEPHIWEGIVNSTYAGVKGGLGGLRLAKRARDDLSAALAIDPGALDGSAYTSLGTLYYRVPGFPLGFGDHDKARSYLEKAIAMAPASIDANYFYAEYLYDEGRYAAAIEHLKLALQAPPRTNREVADRGRRLEASALLAKAREKAG
jgi:tetratricopeptide (TPR) repeat protein